MYTILITVSGGFQEEVAEYSKRMFLNSYYLSLSLSAVA